MNNQNQKINVILLFSYSILIDVLWLVVIAWRTWFSDAYDKLAHWERGLHVTTTVVVFINLALKVAAIALSFMFENKVKQSFQQKYQSAMQYVSKGKDY